MIDLPPLPEPDLGSIAVGRQLVFLGYSDDAMRSYGEACARAALEAAARHVETSFHGYDDEYPSPDHWAWQIRALKDTP